MAVKVHISPKFNQLHDTIHRIAHEGIPEGATDIYQGRNRVVQYTVPGGPIINIKEFHIPNALNRLVYGNVRRSKARRAFENAVRLLEMGINTPMPIAFIEKTDGCRFGLSYFISIQEQGMTDIRQIARSPLRKRLIDGIADIMLQLHCNGVWMKDFSQGNLLWRHEPDDTITYTLVDINRMSFNTRANRKLMQNFRTVTDDPNILRAIVASYAFQGGKDPDHTLEQATAQRRKYLKNRKIKNLLRL